MKLSDLLSQHAPPTVTPRPGRLPSTIGWDDRPGPWITRDDPLAGLKRRAHAALFGELGTQLYDAALETRQLHTLVSEALDRIIETDRIPLSDEERASLVEELAVDVIGFGPLEPFLTDDSVTEIMVNGLMPIFVERAGTIEETDSGFLSEAHLRQVINRIVGDIGRRIDESSPMVDARLPDGSRVNAIVPPLALDGPVLTIRKFSARGFGLDELVETGSLTPELREFLAACVEGRLNLLISGGTGTGKTTLLNALSSMIPETERIVTVEDAAELRLRQRHVIRLESRPANIEGNGAISIRELVRNALRMRPDRIIVGEVRGAESLDMLQAMNTGHDGSLSTVHANTPHDALLRLETMVLMSGVELPLRAIREQTSAAIDLVVHISRFQDGTRRVTQVSEVGRLQADAIVQHDLFALHAGASDPSGRPRHSSIRPTGIRPAFLDRLRDRGLTAQVARIEAAIGAGVGPPV